MANKTKIRSLKGMNRYSENPFTDALRDLKTVEAKSKPLFSERKAADTETGAIHDYRVITGQEYYWKDSSTYTKFFQDNSNNNFIKMGSAGLKLFFFILNNLKVGQDYIHVPFETYSTYAGTTSRTSYYDAVIELVDLKIIQLSVSTHMFYINPTILFNGSREKLLGDAKTKYYELGQFKMPNDVL